MTTQNIVEKRSKQAAGNLSRFLAVQEPFIFEWSKSLVSDSNDSGFFFETFFISDIVPILLTTSWSLFRKLLQRHSRRRRRRFVT